MRKVLTISVAAMAFLVLPAMCMGGLIAHACDCAADASCHCGGDCEHGDGCGHEGGCSDDPCNVEAVRMSRADDSVVTTLQPLICDATHLNANVQHADWTLAAVLNRPSHLSKQPHDPGDLPLLI